MTASTKAVKSLLVLCLIAGCGYRYDETSDSIVVEIADAEARERYIKELGRAGIDFKIIEGGLIEVHGVSAEELDRAMKPFHRWETEKFQERRKMLR